MGPEEAEARAEANKARAEKARKEREALAKKRTDSLLTKLRPLEAATSEADGASSLGSGWLGVR